MTPLRCLFLVVTIAGCGASEPAPAGPPPSASAAPAATSAPVPQATASAAPAASAAPKRESYRACHCCCGGVEPKEVCVSRAKGESLEKVIAREVARAHEPCPPNAGCTRPILYVACD